MIHAQEICGVFINGALGRQRSYLFPQQTPTAPTGLKEILIWLIIVNKLFKFPLFLLCHILLSQSQFYSFIKESILSNQHTLILDHPTNNIWAILCSDFKSITHLICLCANICMIYISFLLKMSRSHPHHHCVIFFGMEILVNSSELHCSLWAN